MNDVLKLIFENDEIKSLDNLGKKEGRISRLQILEISDSFSKKLKDILEKEDSLNFNEDIFDSDFLLGLYSDVDIFTLEKSHKLLKDRDYKKDLSTIFKCKEDDIDFEDMEEYIKNNPSVFKNGNSFLDIYIRSMKYIPDGFIIPDFIYRLSFSSLEEIPDGFNIPDSVKRLYLPKVKNISNDFNLGKLVEKIYLYELEFIPDNYIFSESIIDFYLPKLKRLPKSFSFGKFTRIVDIGSIEGLPSIYVFPDNIKKIVVSNLNSIQKHHLKKEYVTANII